MDSDIPEDMIGVFARMGVSKAEAIRMHDDPAYEDTVMERMLTAAQPKVIDEQSFADMKHTIESQRRIPIPRPRQTRQELIRRLEEDLAMARLPPKLGKTTAKIGLEKHFCTTPIHDLKRSKSFSLAYFHAMLKNYG